MDKFKTGIIVMLVGIAILGIMTSSVSAATCTKSGSTCISCTQGSMTGYNYHDPNIPSAAFVYSYFSSQSDATNKLTNWWGYSSSCVGNGDGRDFTNAVSGGNRYQTHVASGWRNIQSSQGPEPNPLPGWCNDGYSEFYNTLYWHYGCYEDCINSGYCNPGTGIED